MKEETKTNGNVKCPVCGESTGQMRNGANRSGTQTYHCRHCGKFYTPEPKRHEYDDATKEQAIKIYYSGVSGRGVGKILHMNKANVYNWIKKNDDAVDNPFTVPEVDGLYWYIEEKARTETRENVYIMTAVSRKP